MVSKIKRLFYFPIASYFRFFAAIRLKRWNPMIVVVTGSNGKTTLLHMIEAQIGDNARYTHHANSSFGIPFDILGLHRTSLLKIEWIALILKAPFAVFKSIPNEKIYIVEADCDRQGEGKFLASLLNPNVVLWVSTSRTHSMNFDQLVIEKKFDSVEKAISYEFGYFLEYAKEVVMIDGDSSLMEHQIKRSIAKIIKIKKTGVFQKYNASTEGSEFQINDNKYTFKYLLPEEVYLSIELCKKLVEYLDMPFDKSFSKFVMPPGRGSIFKGINGITIVDSSYNLSPGSLEAVLRSFNMFHSSKKWIVIGDMLELGKSEKEEHEKIAEILLKYKFDKIILMGPRVSKYIFPKLNKTYSVRFEGPKETLDYLLANIRGRETILFKGARFMEGIIEHLLENKEDIKKLSRREKIWEIRRKQWGL